MDYRQLGNTDIDVSVICLGTMTFGEQNTETEAHEQLGCAVSQGVNFVDTAEMYPVPPMAETVHRTEEYIGSWLAKLGNRDKIVLATKVSGPSGMDWIREPGTTLKKEEILGALDNSLKRLQTDVVDLYQIHWPARPTNYFFELGYEHKDTCSTQERLDETETILEALQECITAGKIRAIGLSNETPWGVMSFLKYAEMKGLPRVVSVQNPYNLLNRSYEVGLAEVSIREQCGLLAYSPLAFGKLSGKYHDGTPSSPDWRVNKWERFNRYSGEHAHQAVQSYYDLAKAHGLTLTEMSLAYVNSRDFVTSNIIGATSIKQLEENIASVNTTLSQEVIEGIDAIHRQYTYPCP